MKNVFELAAGSIVGRDHTGRGNLLFGKSNQDVFRHSQEDEISIGIVCDGCSEGAHSEFGARLGASLMACSLMDMQMQTELCGITDQLSLDAILEQIRCSVLEQMRSLTRCMDASVSYARFVAEHFLFTTLGVIITPQFTTIFSIGDGVYFLNGEMQRIGPFPGNMPPYLAYGLVASKIDPILLRFSIHAFVSTQDVQTILIGTDGVGDLHEVADRAIPGKAEIVGPTSQFWQDDRFFRGPDQLRRRLALINSEVTKVSVETGDLVRHPGLLPDDTTCIVFRRKS